MLVYTNNCLQVTSISFSVAVAVDKKMKFSVDNLVIGVQLTTVKCKVQIHYIPSMLVYT